MNAIVQETSDKAREIELKSNEFWDAVNDVLSWVPEPLRWIIEPIRVGMAELGQKMREFWDRVKQLFEQPGNADRLKQVGEQWTTLVGDICKDIAETISLDKMRTNIEWQGPAAESYKAQVPPQSEGLTTIKDIAGQVRTSLDNLANSIDSFWLAIKFAFAGFAIAIIAAIAAACTVVGIPAAIGIIIAAVAAALGLVTAAVMALESHVNTIENEQTAIRQRVTDLADGWTMTDTAALSDASAKDGDPSDWRSNR
ncbi:hypothetical protein [Actinokineospora iranica]|uniref:Proteins of 100 residues with WXG n=1 Tax=Actinokineospora iranica TaxID=1271860 RepID=A0A1G6K934_9PSEU|nr:hypothetical protein [Actinokineospora iranica]SDC27378.1 hypothetical protein SAMN05216174_101778 [Actinokineospora iranica]